MKPLRKRVLRAVVLAFVVLALTANVAAADQGEGGPNLVPYDPGLSDGLPTLEPPLWLFE